MKSVLFSFAVVGALYIPSISYAAGDACITNPAGAAAAIDTELSGVTAGKTGAALDAAVSGYVAQLAAVPPSSSAVSACIYSAILKAAMLASPELQARINQVAAAYVAEEQTQTAALEDPVDASAN